MKQLILIYNFILTLLIAGAALSQAHHNYELLYGLLFVPMAVFFGRMLYRRLTKRRFSLKSQPLNTAITRPRVRRPKAEPVTLLEGETLSQADVTDINRRMFIKLIGAAGLSTFIFALFKKSASAAFFGSVPGPGTLAIKDTAGNKIDPAEKQPTDGYEISQIDDAAIPSYYGFLNKDGAWYIAREGNSGEYRYSRGLSDFLSNWNNRGSLSFGLFDNIF